MDWLRVRGPRVCAHLYTHIWLSEISARRWAAAAGKDIWGTYKEIDGNYSRKGTWAGTESKEEETSDWLSRRFAACCADSLQESHILLSQSGGGDGGSSYSRICRFSSQADRKSVQHFPCDLCPGNGHHNGARGWRWHLSWWLSGEETEFGLWWHHQDVSAGHCGGHLLHRLFSRLVPQCGICGSDHSVRWSWAVAARHGGPHFGGTLQCQLRLQSFQLWSDLRCWWRHVL